MASITVAVSTFREGYFDWVVQLLESLKNQSLKDFEVLLVVNSNPRYFNKLKETVIAKELPFGIRLIFNHADGGISQARNIGIKNSTTKYIAFTDDDAIPHSDWLKTLNETFENTKEVGAVTGPVLPYWSPVVREFSSCFPKELYWIIGCTLFNGEGCKVVRNGFASNLAVNRKFAVECGGFNEAFGYNHNNPMAGEEPALCFRLKETGKPTLWNPNSIVFHRITSNRVRLLTLLDRSFIEGKSKAHLRRFMGNGAMNPEVTQFQSVIKAIIRNRSLKSKAMLVVTTFSVLLGFSVYFVKKT